jgi:ABC-type transport system substrate-binding protein
MKNKARKQRIFFFTAFFAMAAMPGCRDKTDNSVLNDVVYRESYDSVYEKIGKEITLDMVEESTEGKAYVTHEGKKYELGMDFLSMAMVYNAKPTEKFLTATDAYNEWWRLFMQRWNLLVPEVPLYSNQYYDVYNAKINELKTTPYWSVTDAIVGAKVLSGDNSVILGSNTELSGSFRNASFGKSAPGAADLAIQTLTSGYATVFTDKDGGYQWAGKDILAWHTQTENADGSKTFVMRIAEDLTFSDGTPIRAENYVMPLLVGSSKVMREAGGGEAAGQTLVGYENFNAYTGEGDLVPFSGVRLLDEYTFSVTVKKEYADYYYAIRYGDFSPSPTQLYGGRYALKDDGRGAYIEKDFYKKTEKNGILAYEMAGEITQNLSKLSEKDFPYAGPYVVSEYDAATRVATLKRNPNYKGDHRGKASIDTISYVKIIPETQLDQLRKGRVDVLASVTGGEETRAVLALVDGVKFKESHYDRAGYGKLAFRCDFGPTQFEEVRRAVTYTIDRNEFAQTFTGGYGSVVHAPYHVGSEAYMAVKDRLKLNKYDYSVEKAKEELRAGGWTYHADGSAYDENGGGIRYKKLEGYEKTYNNLTFASTDNKYKTVKVNGEYYMPLVINWMGTQPNPVTDQLITAWHKNTNANEKIGMYTTYTSGDMNTALYGEYSQMPAYGFTRARFGAVNFATGFTGAAYDQSFAWTIDPDKYDNYSMNYLRDEADFW